jgi:putative copper resistance protein D
MPGTVPPDPSPIEILTEVLSTLAASLPVAIGIVVAFLAVRGGPVAARIRTLALPAAVVLAGGAVLQFCTARAPSPGQTAMFAAAVAGLVLLRWRPSPWPAAGTAVAGALGGLIPVMPSSLAALPRALLTATHVLGALIWVGGLIVLAAAGLLSRRDRYDASGAHDWARTWERFSVLALWCVGAMIVSGTWLAWTHVGTPAQLLTTPYGRHLSVKLGLVAALLAAGAYNTRMLLPRLRAAQADGDTRTALRLAVHHFPGVVAAEAAVAVAVLAVVPFLRGSARTQAGGPAAGPFDLTVFGCGAVLVALTAAALWAGTRVPTRTPGPPRTAEAVRSSAPGQVSVPPGRGRTG